MADVEFADVWDCGDGADIVVVEGVAGVEAHVEVDDLCAGGVDFFEFGEEGFVEHVAAGVVEGVGVGACVDFADIEAGFGGGVDLGGVGVDEGADDHAGVFEFGDDLGEAVELVEDIEAAFGGDFEAAFGDEHGGVGAELGGDVDHLVGGGHLEVELEAASAGAGIASEHVAEASDIVVVDMAAVLAEVDGDAVGPAELGLVGGADGVWFAASAGLADGGDMVNIHTELDHVGMIAGWGMGYDGGRPLSGDPRCRTVLTTSLPALVPSLSL